MDEQELEHLGAPMYASPVVELRSIGMATAEEASDIGERIVGLVENWWKSHQSPLLLSRLGNLLEKEDSRQIKQKGFSLRSYITHNLSDRIRLIQDKDNLVIIASVPGEVNEDGYRLLEKLRRNDHEGEGDRHPRFRPALWAAFRIPLDKDKERYIDSKEPIRFRDIPSKEGPQEGIRVDRRFIEGPNSDPTEIGDKIREWLKENALEETPFLASRKRKSTHLPSDDLLGRLLFSLDSDDLKRVSMPLDIIKKLRQSSL